MTTGCRRCSAGGDARGQRQEHAEKGRDRVECATINAAIVHGATPLNSVHNLDQTEGEFQGPSVACFQAAASVDPAGSRAIWNGIPFETQVIPAKAGIQSVDRAFPEVCRVDSRFRGNDCDFERPRRANDASSIPPADMDFRVE